METKIDYIDFAILRHRMIRLANELTTESRKIEWIIGDMFYDWKRIESMKEGENLILEIYDNGTNIVDMNLGISFYQELHSNKSRFFGVHASMIPGIEGMQYVIEELR